LLHLPQEKREYDLRGLPMIFDLTQYKNETRQLTLGSGPRRFGLGISGFEYFSFNVLRFLWRTFYQRRMSESKDLPVPILPVPASFLQKHVEHCRVFADRYEVLKSLPKGKVWAEVGTFRGEFARSIIDICQPSKLDLMDLTFDLVKELGYVHESDTVTFYAGESTICLLAQPDKKYDFIYIDAGHDLIDVARDAEAAMLKLKDDGMIIFNDYICFAYKEMRPYGVVPVVNSLVAHGNWEIACFAFQNNMYCDVALRKIA
jgi:hypothetical protein